MWLKSGGNSVFTAKANGKAALNANVFPMPTEVKVPTRPRSSLTFNHTVSPRLPWIQTKSTKICALLLPPLRSTESPTVGRYVSVVPLVPLPSPDIDIEPTASAWENVPGGVVDVCGSGNAVTVRVNGPAASRGFPNVSISTGTPTSAACAAGAAPRQPNASKASASRTSRMSGRDREGCGAGRDVESVRSRPDDGGDHELDAIGGGVGDGSPSGGGTVVAAHVALPRRERPAVQSDDEIGHVNAPSCG